VSLPEAVEVQAINVLAPFILNSKLKPLLLKSGRDTYIVNVSAMEGQFYRYALRLGLSFLKKMKDRSKIINNKSFFSALEWQEAQDAAPSAYQHGKGCAQHDDAHVGSSLRGR
jgi:NAD(P)-dependent dehydrogenase (short-subunit alcohol dehydrogenase family)